MHHPGASTHCAGLQSIQPHPGTSAHRTGLQKLFSLTPALQLIEPVCKSYSASPRRLSSSNPSAKLYSLTSAPQLITCLQSYPASPRRLSSSNRWAGTFRLTKRFRTFTKLTELPSRWPSFSFHAYSTLGGTHRGVRPNEAMQPTRFARG